MAEHENKEGVLTETTPDDDEEVARGEGPDPDSVEPASAVNLEAGEERAVSVKRAADGANGGSQVSSPVPPVSETVVGTAHDAHADHGLAHTTPVWLLGAILGALMVLTVVTVLVTGVDLGAQGNLIVAMVIATIKATLVVAFFMHLVWDKKLHLILFLTSVLFLILFLSVSTTDRSEYQPAIDNFQMTQPAQ